MNMVAKINRPRRVHVTSKNRTPEGAIYAGRGSAWAKLVKAKFADKPAYEANLFRDALMQPTNLSTRIKIRKSLAGHDLACTTPDGILCFATVLLEIANSDEIA